MRVAIFTLLTLLLATGCQSVIPHPPTYDDFVSVYKVKHSTNAEVISSEDIDLFQALEFTDEDLATLRSSTDMTTMIGAGIVRSGHLMADEMLLDASQKESKAGVAEIWLVRRELKDLDSPFQREEHERRLHGLVEKLYREASDNALSHYLLASLKTSTFEDVDAINLIKSGNSKQFNGYSKETFLAIVAAAESIGYSPYAAYHYSLGSLVPVNIYSTLRKRCSDLFQRNHGVEARIECLVMGQNIEISSPTMLEKLLHLGFNAMH